MQSFAVSAPLAAGPSSSAVSGKQGPSTTTRGHFVHHLSARIMADSETVDKVDNMRRNVVRGLLVFCVLTAVTTFTVLQYATNESLRNSVTTQRLDDYTSLHQGQLGAALCPCRQPDVPYAQFLTGLAPMANGSDGFNSTAVGIACAHFISPNASADIAAQGGDVTRLAGLVNYGGLYQGCLRISRLVWEMHFGTLAADAIVLNTGHLLTQRELMNVRLKPAISGIMLRTLSQKFDTYWVQSDQMDQIKDSFAQDSPESRLITVQHENALTSANLIATALQGRAQGGFYHDMTKYLQDHVLSSPDSIYRRYAQLCNPLYCDISERKSVWGRITEFLALIGGLWTLFLGMGLLLWALVDILLTAP